MQQQKKRLTIIDREVKARNFFKGASVVIPDGVDVDKMLYDAFVIAKDSFYNFICQSLIGSKPHEISEIEFYKSTLSKLVPLGPGIRLDKLFDEEQLKKYKAKYSLLDKKYIGLIKRTKDFLSVDDKEYGFIEVTADDPGITSEKGSYDTVNIRIFVSPYYIEDSTEFTENMIFETLILIVKLLTNKYQTSGAFMYTTSASRGLTTYYYIVSGNIIDVSTTGDALTKLHLDNKISVGHTINVIQTMLELYNYNDTMTYVNDEIKKAYQKIASAEKKTIELSNKFEKSSYEINKFIESTTDSYKRLEAQSILDKYTAEHTDKINILRDSINNAKEYLTHIEEYKTNLLTLYSKIKQKIYLSYFKFKHQ